MWGVKVTIPLFKYLPQGIGEVVLRNRTLRWSTPQTLNDPFDMQTGLDLAFNKAEVVDIALEKSWESFNNVEAPIGNALGVMLAFMREKGVKISREEFMKEMRPALIECCANLRAGLPELDAVFLKELATTKVLCLSGSPIIVPLWTHYAQEHKGIVLEFGEAAGLDSPWKLARPMNYVDAPPKLYDDEFWSDMMSGRTSMDAKTIMRRYIFTKGKAWESECEHRISTGEGRKPDALFEDAKFAEQELVSITFGCRMDGNDREKFAELAKVANPEITIRQAIKQGAELVITKL